MKATQEQIQRTTTAARSLLLAIEPLDLMDAVEHLRTNPPSAEAVAALALIVKVMTYSAQQSSAASNSRPRRKTDAPEYTGQHVEVFRLNYIATHGKETGWKTNKRNGAVEHFETDIKTLNRRHKQYLAGR